MNRRIWIVFVLTVALVVASLTTFLSSNGVTTLSPAGKSLVSRLKSARTQLVPERHLVVEYRRPAVVFRLWLGGRFHLRHKYLDYSGSLTTERLDEILTLLIDQSVFQRNGEGPGVENTVILEDEEYDEALWTRVEGPVPKLLDQVIHDIVNRRDPLPVDAPPDDGGPLEDGRR